MISCKICSVFCLCGFPIIFPASLANLGSFIQFFTHEKRQHQIEMLQFKVTYQRKKLKNVNIFTWLKYSENMFVVVKYVTCVEFTKAVNEGMYQFAC